MPAKELVGDFASASGGDILRYHSELPLNLILLCGEGTRIA